MPRTRPGTGLTVIDLYDDTGRFQGGFTNGAMPSGSAMWESDEREQFVLVGGGRAALGGDAPYSPFMTDAEQHLFPRNLVYRSCSWQCTGGVWFREPMTDRFAYLACIEGAGSATRLIAFKRLDRGVVRTVIDLGPAATAQWRPAGALTAIEQGAVAGAGTKLVAVDVETGTRSTMIDLEQLVPGAVMDQIWWAPDGTRVALRLRRQAGVPAVDG